MIRNFIRKIKHKTGLKVLSLLLMLTSFNTANAAGLDLNDVFFRAGKYYVVAGVLCIMFVLIFFFIIRLDRKVSKLEKNIKNEN